MGMSLSRDREASQPQLGNEQAKYEAESRLEEDNTIVIDRLRDDTTTAGEKTMLPYNYEAILKDADSSIDMSSQEKIYDQLVDGVFLNQKRKKFWVDKKTNRNCFVLYPRDFSITWADDESYWSWIALDESPSDASVEAAELNGVCWLEVMGKFRTNNLTPGTLYEVVFVVMLKDPAFGWDVPVNFRLVLPNGEKQEREELMMMQLRYRWLEIPAGEFTASPENNGEIEFSMFEEKGGNWKKGLVLKGVAIRPKN